MNILEKYVKLLKSGQIVGFPTETVFGLAIDYHNKNAYLDLMQLKNAPKNKPITLHFSDKEMIKTFIKQPHDAFERLAFRFLPGPLTIITYKSEKVPDWISNDDTVGIRLVSHPVGSKFIRLCGGIVAATSANLYNQPALLSSQDVLKTFAKLEDQVVFGKVDLKVASTIIDLTKQPYRLIREGMLAKDELELVLKAPII